MARSDLFAAKAQLSTHWPMILLVLVAVYVMWHYNGGMAKLSTSARAVGARVKTS